jgi:hypothetical protein
MTEMSISDKKLRVQMKGWDKLWTLRSQLEVPLPHVKAIRVDPDIGRAPKGLRTLGTYWPGVLTAGSFRQQGNRVFWNVRHPEKAIVIDLQNERYDRLVLEVADPSGTVASLNEAIANLAA